MVDFSTAILQASTVTVSDGPVAGIAQLADTVLGCSITVVLPSGQLADQTATVFSANPTTYTLPVLKDCQGTDLNNDFTFPVTSQSRVTL